MASIFKRREQRPIPEGAELVAYRGKPYAVWTNAQTGRTQRAPLSKDGRRVVAEAEFYTILYFDHTGKRRKKGTRYPDKDAAQQYANMLEKDAEDRRKGIIDSRQERLSLEGRRPLLEHLADFRQYLADKGNTEQHVAQTARQVQVIIDAGPRGTHRGLGRGGGDAGYRQDAGTEDDPASLRTCNAHLAVSQDVYPMAVEREADPR